MLKEFREFALRGNVIDLAVGIIIGAAFNGIVQSLVNDILMPPLGLLMNNVDFSSLYINLSGAEYTSLQAAKDAGAPTINIGVFINTIINFVLVAIAVFLLIRGINRLRRRQDIAAEPPPGPTTKDCPYCLTHVPLAATRCPACTSELLAV